MIEQAEIRVNRDSPRHHFSKEFEDVPVWLRISDQPALAKEKQDNEKKPVAAYVSKQSTKPVAEFDSMGDAGRWLEAKLGTELSASNLNTAMRMNIRCGGYYWRRISDEA